MSTYVPGTVNKMLRTSYHPYFYGVWGKYELDNKTNEGIVTNWDVNDKSKYYMALC
jgi:hypothetical protein